MRKNTMIRMAAIALALVTVLTPVTAQATTLSEVLNRYGVDGAEMNIYNWDKVKDMQLEDIDYHDTAYYGYADAYDVVDVVMNGFMEKLKDAKASGKKPIVSNKELYDAMATRAICTMTHDIWARNIGEVFRPYFDELNGCYQENGLRIYTVFDGKTKTFKKTGSWSILVGGNKKSNNYGYVKFTAPKAGRYKFTLSSKDNVLRGPVCAYETTDNGKNFKEDYKGSDRVFCDKRTGTVENAGYRKSSARKYVFSVTLKKGQSIKIKARSCEDTDNYYKVANTYVGFDLKIEKIK